MFSLGFLLLKNKKKSLKPWAFVILNTLACGMLGCKQRGACTKDTVSKTKRPPTDWERVFTYPKSDRGLICNIYKVLKKVDSRKSNNIPNLMGYYESISKRETHSSEYLQKETRESTH
jgi:hypothetical protein